VTSSDFTIYPAIDLRHGQVVRLSQGDPQRQTMYGDNPAASARRWLTSGASWLHVVNLDGALGEPGQANQAALLAIAREAAEWHPAAAIQFGGGLRTLYDIEQAFSMGVSRVVLGTMAVEQPEIAEQAIREFEAQRFALGMDLRDGQVQVRGWVTASALDPVKLAARYWESGMRTCVYTNVARDGLGEGADIEATRQFALQTRFDTIASGGVASLEDVKLARQAGLSGVIIGRALYEGSIDLKEALSV
jgi:phosphoribosylformimino-5-aminoimidazole carboxamide ribotide isomerase